MLIKGESYPITYTVFSSQTGLPVTGVTRHAIALVAINGTATVLSAIVTESGNGRYTFTLPASYTNVDTLTIRITTETPNTIVAPIICRFTDVTKLIPDTSAIYTAIENATEALQSDITTVSGTITAQITPLNTNIVAMQSDIVALAPKVSAIYTKLDTYPIGTLVARTTDIPSAASIATEVLTTGCTTSLAANSDDFSLVSLILSSFYSTLNFTSNTWTIKKPDGTTLLTRHLTTSDTVQAITEIKD